MKDQERSVIDGFAEMVKNLDDKDKKNYICGIIKGLVIGQEFCSEGNGKIHNAAQEQLAS